MEELRDLFNYGEADSVEKERIDNAFSSIWPTRIKDFFSFVEERWKSVLSTLPTFAKINSQRLTCSEEEKFPSGAASI